MNKDMLQNKVTHLLVERLQLSDETLDLIEGDTKLLELCEDSLDLLDTTMYLEDEFNVNIPSPEKFVTVDNLVDFIYEALNGTATKTSND